MTPSVVPRVANQRIDESKVSEEMSQDVHRLATEIIRKGIITIAELEKAPDELIAALIRLQPENRLLSKVTREFLRRQNKEASDQLALQNGGHITIETGLSDEREAISSLERDVEKLNEEQRGYLARIAAQKAERERYAAEMEKLAADNASMQASAASIAQKGEEFEGLMSDARKHAEKIEKDVEGAPAQLAAINRCNRIKGCINASAGGVGLGIGTAVSISGGSIAVQGGGAGLIATGVGVLASGLVIAIGSLYFIYRGIRVMYNHWNN